MTQLSVINVTMSSIDVAKLTEKEHRNVMADIRKLEDYYKEIYSAEKSAELIKSATYKDSLQRTYPCYELSKDACLDLITGYSLPHRHAVNQRWMELEAANMRPLTTMEMVAQMALKAVEQERIAAEHEAKLLQHEARLEKTEAQIKDIVDTEQWFTARAAGILYNYRHLSSSNVQKLGKALSNKSREMGIEIIKRPHKDFGEVGTYHIDVIRAVFDEDNFQF